MDRIGPRANDRIITRVCPSCNKGFGSGKALGGHMRIHAHHEKILQRKQPPPEADLAKKIKSNDTGIASINWNKKPMCFLCGKSFLSMKSLYGHMRCHPDRCWRGIKPSPSAKASSSSSLSDSLNCEIDSPGKYNGPAVVNLMESLRGWSVTAKRGGKGISSSTASAAASTSEAELLVEAAHLMMADSLKSDLTHKQSYEEFEAANSYSLTFTAEIEDTSGVPEKTNKRRREAYPDGYGRDCSRNSSKMGSTDAGGIGVFQSTSSILDKGKREAALNSVFFTEDQSGTEHESDDTDNESDIKKNGQQFNYADGKVILMNNKSKRKKIKLMDLEDLSPPATAMQEKYRCTTCNKGFSTCQALGGHMSSHNQTRMNIQKKPMDKFSPAVAVDEIQANPICYQLAGNGNKYDESAANSKVGCGMSHKRTICNQSFPTVQALGCHKWSHWNSPVRTPPSEVISPGEASRTACPKLLDFDLNELPQLEDEAGYASSSYKSID